MTCRMPGSLFLRAELFDAVCNDLFSMTATSALSVFVVFLLMYRGSMRTSLCVMTPTLFALGVTFGIYSLLSPSIDLIAASAAAMLIGLGDDFGIHLMDHYFKAEGTTAARLIAALTHTGRAIVASALTMAAAFFSILLTGMKSFYVLGIVAGIGILLTMASFLFLFPLMVIWLKPVHRPWSSKTRMTDFFYEVSRKIAWPVIIIILVCLPFFYQRLRFEGDFKMFLPPNSLVLRDMQVLERQQISASGDGLVLQIETRGYQADSAALAAAQQAAGSNVVWKSPFTILPTATDLDRLRLAFQTGMASNQITPDTVRGNLQAVLREKGLRDRPEYESYVASLFGALKDGIWERELYALPMVRPYFSEDRRYFYAIGVRRDNAVWTAPEVAPIVRRVQATGPACTAISGGLLMASIKTKVIPDCAKSAAASVVFIFLILWIHMKKFVHACMVMVPLVFGLLTVALFMGVYSISFNFFNLTVLPLVLGLSIDDGIHFMNTFHECRSARQAFRDTVIPLCISTFTTIQGFGSLVTASFPGIVQMGIFVMLGLTACLAATLIIVPMFARLLERKHNDAEA